MSKITFRADDELVERIEAIDASKSEVMREALREYLDGTSDDRDGADGSAESLDAFLAERVDELVADRLAAPDVRERGRAGPQDVNVNVSLETEAPARASAESEPRRRGRAADDPSADRDEAARQAGETSHSCGQCGESLADDHVYCPNCGEKAARRLFCECGDEVRSDWGFCPSCGRRTPAADVLDQS